MQNIFERQARTMEKINKEELMKMLGMTEEEQMKKPDLTEAELEMITGGKIDSHCYATCLTMGYDTERCKHACEH